MITQYVPNKVFSGEVLGEIWRMIEDVRSGVATAVNTGVTMLCWLICIANAFPDEGIVATIVKDKDLNPTPSLTLKFPNGTFTTVYFDITAFFGK